MSASPLPQSSGYSANALHPALSGGDPSTASPTPSVWVCPLPHSVLSHDQLLSELSHELKTPLAGIMGLAQVIQQQRNPVAGRERQYADLIYQKSQQLLIAINDLFDFTQLSTRQFVLQLRPLELAPIFKTALQTTQRAIGPVMDEPELTQDVATEHWMVADQARLEQLFTHLTSYLFLLSPVERRLHLVVHTQNNWTAITLTATPARCANTGQASFWGTNPFSALNTAVVPGESSAVLKFLLARQLAQLHGGEISWLLTQPSGLEATVFLPSDLTRATRIGRSPTPDEPTPPFCLILSLDTDTIGHLTHVLQTQNLWSAVARSLLDAQDKLRNLEPSILILDSPFGQACGWDALSHWLTGQVQLDKMDFIWIGSLPPTGIDLHPEPAVRWPNFPSPETVLETLNHLQSRRNRRSTVLLQPATKTTPSAKPLMLLQLGDVSLARSPDPLIIQLMTQLSRTYGCSILAVDDLEQAELLARIWQPKVTVCLSGLPEWAVHLENSPFLSRLPLFCLMLAEQAMETRALPIAHIPFMVAADHSPQSMETLTHQLYQRLVEAASANRDAA